MAERIRKKDKLAPHESSSEEENDGGTVGEEISFHGTLERILIAEGGRESLCTGGTVASGYRRLVMLSGGLSVSRVPGTLR